MSFALRSWCAPHAALIGMSIGVANIVCVKVENLNGSFVGLVFFCLFPFEFEFTPGAAEL